MLTAPQFNLNGQWWTARVVLPSRIGFENRSGPTGVLEPSPSNGSVPLIIAPEGRGTEPLTPSELESAAWLLNNEAAVWKSALEGLLEQCPSLQQQYGYSEDERVEFMPDVQSVQDFRNLVGLHSVNIHQVTKGGLPYIGLELGCQWDDEHGLARALDVMTKIHLSAVEASFLLTSESDGSGDYLVAIDAKAYGFAGHADGHVVGAAWLGFCAELGALEKSRTGEAILESAMPGEFSIRVGSLNGVGHMSVSGVLGYSRSGWPRQNLTFAFEFEPSQLAAVQLAVQRDGHAFGVPAR